MMLKIPKIYICGYIQYTLVIICTGFTRSTHLLHVL